jgi:hypothetical protein
VKLSEMRREVCAGHWRGSKKGAGRVGGRRGREIRRRARVRTRRSTASAERAEPTGRVHGAERGERGVRGNGSATVGPGPRNREREGARGGELPLTGGVRLSGGAGARACGLAGLTGLVWAAFSFPFSLNFLIPFPFLFL